MYERWHLEYEATSFPTRPVFGQMQRIQISAYYCYIKADTLLFNYEVEFVYVTPLTFSDNALFA